MTLAKLKPGQSARIKTVSVSGSLKRRLMDMGVLPGVLVTVEKVAPLGDPIDVIIKNYHLSLRKSEAEGIAVED